MRSVGIIGSNSFLAKNLATQLGDEYAVHLYGRAKADTSLAPNQQQIDFYYPEKVFDFQQLLNYDYIVFTAAAGVQANKSEPVVGTYDVNFYLPLQIITFLDHHQYKGKFFTFGSYFEIGNNTSETPYTEQEVMFAANAIPNAYCDSKRLLSRYYANKQFSINWFHLIIPSLYGYGENETRLIPYVVNALQNETELKTSSGVQTRQYLHVGDLVRLIITLFHEQYTGDVYNVAGPDAPLMIRDLVSLIHQLLGKPYVQPEQIATRDQGMLILSIDDSKVRSAVTQWQPLINMTEGIKTYFNHAAER